MREGMSSKKPDLDADDPLAWLMGKGTKNSTYDTAAATKQKTPKAETAAQQSGAVTDDTPESFDPRSWTAPTIFADYAPPRPSIFSGHFRMLAIVALVLCAGGLAYYYHPWTATPKKIVIKPVRYDPLPSLKTAKSTDANESHRIVNIMGANDIANTLIAAGVDSKIANNIEAMAIASPLRDVFEIRLEFDLAQSKKAATLIRLKATQNDGSGILIQSSTSGYKKETLQAKLTSQIRVVRGEIDSDSFYSSAVAAGVTDSLISDFAAAFSFDFDFQREIAPGDVFEAVYEYGVNPSGQQVGQPKLLYVSLTTAAKSKSLYRYKPAGDTEYGWFDGKGGSIVKTLMRTPVDGARISSNFGYRRHPVLGYQKLHRGTDFAAPSGTPIYASGNGTINFAAPKGANGNFIRLIHDNGWVTLYLHLSRFADGIAPGVRVMQGQKIGEVGTTGRSTGPHLHYEVHVDGSAVDPLSIDTGTGKTLDENAMKVFLTARNNIDTSRASTASN
jgi:murein DD-endopeptidase MepM/ murein hydrolase activator NlpD